MPAADIFPPLFDTTATLIGSFIAPTEIQMALRSSHRQLTHRYAFQAFLICLGFLCLGCTSTAFKRDTATIEKNPNAGSSVQLIDDLARPYGMNTIRVEGVSMVRGLNGTGGDPPPSSEREMLLEEMRIHEVDKPQQVLGSKNTALVTVQAILPPGVQKGDPIDVEVRVPPRQNVKSLQSGWLMPTRLREYARVKNRIAEGHLRGFAKGDVLVDAIFASGSGDDPVLHNRGRVLGGGVASKTRNLGLTVRDEHLSVATSARIGEAINRRFHIYDRGLQRPVANPKRDRFIELLVHPRYQDNVIRYMRVVQSIPVRFGAGGIAQRLRDLETELLNPSQSAATALKLEALGEDGKPVLRAGLQHGDNEVRFYSAEALAYLNDSAAVDGLVNAIKTESAFRKRSFIALGAMDDAKAHDALIELMHHDSVETRYSAFRTLRRIMPDDPHVNGERLGSFYLHVIESNGQSLVHVLRSERPEIVLFGSDHKVELPLVIYAGEQIVVKGDVSGEVEVTKIVAGVDDQTIKCPAQIEPIIRSIVDLGGTYPNVVQAIAQAKKNNVLVSRLEFDAVPTSNRTYRRQDDASEQAQDLSDARKKKRLSEASSSPSNPLRQSFAMAGHSGLPEVPAAPIEPATEIAFVAQQEPATSGVELQSSLAQDSFEPIGVKSTKSILFAQESTDEPPVPSGVIAGIVDATEIGSSKLEAVRAGVAVSFANDDLPPVIDKVSHKAPVISGDLVVSGNLLVVRDETLDNSHSSEPLNSSEIDSEIDVAPEPKPVGRSKDGKRKSVADTHSLATLSDTIEFGQ